LAERALPFFKLL
jgi:ribonuclease HI